MVLHNSSEGDCAPKIPSRHPMHVELPKILFVFSLMRWGKREAEQGRVRGWEGER